MKKNVRVILAPDWESAKNLKPEATVEAEYGEKVLEGTKVTLAHHVEKYKDNSAPCNTKNVPVLEDGDTIVVSHIDLDTIGGVMALRGDKPNDPIFWKSAEFIDLNGPHYMHKIPKEAQDKMNAYYAWRAKQQGAKRVKELVDVTETIDKHAEILNEIVEKENKELIKEGKKWVKETEKLVESCLVEETDNVRIFKIPKGVRAFTNSSYYSKKDKKVKPAIVTFNENFNTITVSAEKGQFNAKELMQNLFGPEAGGRPSIAGSPRNKDMTEEDFKKAIEAVKRTMEEYSLQNNLEEKKSKTKVNQLEL